MASVDSLPADQRAVLALVLGRGRSYDEIARLLSIERAAVRARALAALDALGPQTSVPAERRALITDYLLGQLSPALAVETRARLAESASERAWARVVSSELAPLSSGPLPAVSAEGSAARPPPPPADRSSQAPVSAAPSRPESEPESEPEPKPESKRESKPRDDAPVGRATIQGRNVSRLGGAVLIGIAAVVVVAVVFAVIKLSNSDSGSSSQTSSVASAPNKTATTTTTTATTASSTTGSGSAQVVAQINLTPPNPASKAAGIAEVLKEGATDGIAIVAQKMAPNTTKPPNAYAVWLYNSPTDAHILGFVNPGVGASGGLSTAGGLPANAAHYKELIVTLETQASPTTPGKIVLQGALTGI